MLQSYYEEQKREQMQGPVLKRLEEEQQQMQAPQATSPDTDQWQHSEDDMGHQATQQQPDLPFDESNLPFGQLELPFGESSTSIGDQQQPSLQLSGHRSWAGSRQHQQPQCYNRTEANGSVSSSIAGSVLGYENNSRGSKPYVSPKPPLPSRPQRQISSEMSYLGGSADSSPRPD